MRADHFAVSRWRTLTRRRVLIGASAAAAMVGLSASAAPGLAQAGTPTTKPVITSGPADPTKAATATFRFRDEQPGVTFQCALDDTTATACNSGVTYNNVSTGQHTFHLWALATGFSISDEVTASWLVERVAPTVSYTFPSTNSSIGPARWADGCPAPGICGSASDSSGIASVFVAVRRGSTGPYWDGTAFARASAIYLRAQITTISPTSVSWRLALPLPSIDGPYSALLWVTDRAGNITLGTPAANRGFVVDSIAPSTPIITSGKFDDDVQVLRAPASVTSAAFGFTIPPPADPRDTPTNVKVECALDPSAVGSASFMRCTSPVSYSGLNEGSHCLVVRATDAAGNVASASYCWSIVRANTTFAISGDAPPISQPGAPSPIDVRITNPYPFAFTVTSIVVDITSRNPACPATPNFATSPLAQPVRLGPGQTATLSELHVPPIKWPAITLIDTDEIQDACVGAQLILNYSGDGVKA